jgi:ABC-type nickel/cobalt efflux system permease component RcnA
MFVLILVGLLYVFVDFSGSYQNQHKHAKEPPKSTQTYKRTTKINKNIQKNHQNQHKHTKDQPKSTKTYKRTTKINKNIQKNHLVLLHVFVDFGGSFVCFC